MASKALDNLPPCPCSLYSGYTSLYTVPHTSGVRHGPTTGPLHSLFPAPVALFTRYLHDPFPDLLQIFA